VPDPPASIIPFIIFNTNYLSITWAWQNLPALPEEKKYPEKSSRRRNKLAGFAGKTVHHDGFSGTIIDA